MISVTVQVNLYWLPRESRKLSVGDNCTVREMLGHLRVDQMQWGSVLVVINGKSMLPDDTLGDRDSVVILPALCGG